MSRYPPSSSPQSPAESTAEARAMEEGPFQESQVTITVWAVTADLRIPLASLPGFDPLGLYVQTADGPLLCVSRGYGDGWWSFRGPYSDRDSKGTLLDLSDSATRDRVARWVAEQVGLVVGCTAPSWLYAAKGAWQLWALGNRSVHFGSYARIGHWDGEGVDVMLDDLAPERLPTELPTFLPDGSRQVDAIALARVAVHLGSQP